MPAHNNCFHQLSKTISSMQGEQIGHCIANDSSTGCCALQNAVVVHMIARFVPVYQAKRQLSWIILLRSGLWETCRTPAPTRLAAASSEDRQQAYTRSRAACDAESAQADTSAASTAVPALAMVSATCSPACRDSPPAWTPPRLGCIFKALLSGQFASTVFQSIANQAVKVLLT